MKNEVPRKRAPRDLNQSPRKSRPKRTNRSEILKVKNKNPNPNEIPEEKRRIPNENQVEGDIDQCEKNKLYSQSAAGVFSIFCLLFSFLIAFETKIGTTMMIIKTNAQTMATINQIHHGVSVELEVVFRGYEDPTVVKLFKSTVCSTASSSMFAKFTPL
jgi:hypothetical protein